MRRPLAPWIAAGHYEAPAVLIRNQRHQLLCMAYLQLLVYAEQSYACAERSHLADSDWAEMRDGLQGQLQARARTLSQGVSSMGNERVALEQSVAELNGKAIALERWLGDNEAKLPSGEIRLAIPAATGLGKQLCSGGSSHTDLEVCTRPAWPERRVAHDAWSEH